ncbi:MAG: signal peptidase II [Deltaproteobacteria bacterium]|jgi:signal peptidase II|uniref:Lipoprotein signal peptidase n=1 Tax=Candidatus Acidulodesulfobacterium acidiphilum TaxID=2597224 RepID=A0A520XE89_9DELT|nr:signal peptidase II [Deltaproteobacteria bacterium]RZV39466.1 MAG: signal peptidase II [Candidatus Acidulodesulfobacterium acidiphilum]
MKKKIIILISVFFPVLILDQLLKYIINNKISLIGKITVIKHYFNIVHVDNTGVAFGLMSGYSNILIILLTALIIAALIYFLFKTKINSNLLFISSSLIISGAFSNLLSRIFQGYVVDFLDFHIYAYHWPSFNVADSCVVVGTILFFISIMKYI